MTTLTARSLANGLVRRQLPGQHGFALLENCDEMGDTLITMAAGLDPACAMTMPDGSVVGLDIEIDQPLPVIPTEGLRARWARTPLTGNPVIDDHADVAADVAHARLLNSLSLNVYDPTCAQHEEALDFADSTYVSQNFFYLDDPLHRRRVHMLADVVAWRINRTVAEKGSAVVLEIGPGLSPIFRAAIDRLDATTRTHVTFRAVDISEDLLRYGLSKGWIDDGIVANLAHIDPEQLEQLLGQPDVLIMAEVLEHVQGSASVFARSLLPWLRRSGAYFVGSVPNTTQGAELLRLAKAEGAPHQLTRPLFDETVDHVAFYTYPTLRRALTQVWSLQDVYVWSNGVRLDPLGKSVCYDAGLRFPHRGDRLCFVGRCI